MRKNSALILIILLFAVWLSACSSTTDSDESPTPVISQPNEDVTPEDSTLRITDMTGREIVLNEPATSIIALSAADCEILYALGAGDLIVGRGTYCDFPPDVLDKPSVESGASMNVEQIMALNPEIVLMTTMAQTTEQVEALETAGAKVVVIDAQDIAGVYKAIAIIGQLVDKNNEADNLINEMKETFAEIEQKSTGDGSKTVYFEVNPLEFGLWTAGTGTFIDELAAVLGLKNAFSDVAGWGEVSQEQVIERDPDYIVTITMHFGDDASPVVEILGRNGWENMKAIRNKAVFNADSNEVARPGPRLMDAANSLYEFVYGQ